MTNKKTCPILYVEDDPGLARLVQKTLARAGYRVDLACDGGEGLAMAEREAYGIVIVDYNLPVCDGLEVLRRLRRAGIETPVIMLTGAGTESVAVDAMKLGASDYVVKDPDGGYLALFPSVIERIREQQRLLDAKRHWEEERERLIVELQRALAEVRHLSGLLPICSCCKKIRDDQGYWSQVEVYIQNHSEAEFSHSICPDCAQRLYGIDLVKKDGS